MTVPELAKSYLAAHPRGSVEEFLMFLAEQIHEASFTNDRGAQQRVRDASDCADWLRELAPFAPSSFPGVQ